MKGTDDDIDVSEVRYERVSGDDLPSLTALSVVLPLAWGDTREIHFAVRHDEQAGYTAQAELSSGGFVGLWASRLSGQPDEPMVLVDDAGLRVTWSPERLRARVTAADTSLFVSGDGVAAGHFAAVLRSLRVRDR